MGRKSIGLPLRISLSPGGCPGNGSCARMAGNGGERGIDARAVVFFLMERPDRSRRREAERGLKGKRRKERNKTGLKDN